MFVIKQKFLETDNNYLNVIDNFRKFKGQTFVELTK